eukprot:60510-Pyramimonas_sp.AAC.1
MAGALLREQAYLPCVVLLCSKPCLARLAAPRELAGTVIGGLLLGGTRRASKASGDGSSWVPRR